MKTQKSVLVDVYGWLKAIEKFGEVPMEGVWRVILPFCKRFTPAFYVGAGESVSLAAIALLEAKIGTIRRYDSETVLNAECGMWFSIAVDFPSPVIAWKNREFVCTTVIHDDLCLKGMFGEFKRQTYLFGAAHNDAFFYNSEHSWKTFCAQAITRKTPLFHGNIGCVHSFMEAPAMLPEDTRWRDMCTAVHSIYPRKNLAIEARVAYLLGRQLTHAGRAYEMPENTPELVMQYGLRMCGTVSEADLAKIYQKTEVFMCLSSDEGFSIPPMEAILAGVREIWLSDIPAHREIYGAYNINWIDLNDPAGSVHRQLTERIVKVTKNQALNLYSRFHPTTLANAFATLAHYCK